MMESTPPEEADRRRYAEDVYRQIREEHQRAFQLQGEYGKWLIGTIAAVNFGAAYVLVSADQYIPAHTKILALSIFVGGIVTIILAGFVTWINWHLLTVHSARRSVPAMIVNPEKWPADQPILDRWIEVTFWCAISLGVVSLAALPVGSAVVMSGMP